MLLDRLFVVFRDTVDEHASDNVPLVVLEVLEFDLGQLSITRVTSIDPHSLWKANHPDKAARVEALVDRRYDCFSRACQSVYAAYHGKQVFAVYMDRFEVYLRSTEIDPALIGSATSSRMCRGERVIVTFSPALAAARAESLEIPPVTSPQPVRGEPWEGWISVGSGQPYAHSSTPLHKVEALAANMLREVLSAHSLRGDTHMQLNSSRRAPWQDTLSAGQRPRDYRKRSSTLRPTRSRRASCGTERRAKIATHGRRRCSPDGWSSWRTISARASAPTRCSRASSSALGCRGSEVRANR